MRSEAARAAAPTASPTIVTDPHPRFVESSAAFGDNGFMDANNLTNDAPSDRSDARRRPKPASPRLAIEVVDELRKKVRSGEETIAAAARRLKRSENSIRRAVRSFDRTSGSHSYKDATEPDVPAKVVGRPPRISADVVAEVRAAKGKVARSVLATKFGISRAYVSRLWKGDARLDVLAPPAVEVESPEALQ